MPNRALEEAFNTTPPPEWSLRPRKPLYQHGLDLVGAPLRLAALPDRQSERLHLTSLRAERFRAVMPHLRGRLLDVGCGDNMLIRLYEMADLSRRTLANTGVDVKPWTPEVVKITSSASLPFPDESFDTVTFVACLNHIPERGEALKEAARLLKPSGRVVITMIGRAIGIVGHAIWWYSEDKHRQLHPDEVMGLDNSQIVALAEEAGLHISRHDRFVYGLNNLFVCEKSG